MLANDMRRLAEEISNAYEERIKGVAEMRAADAERKSTTQADLKKTADQLRADLDQFKSDLDASEDDRKDTTQAELNEKAEELRGSLASFRAELSATVAGTMGELKKDRLEAARAWNEILSTMRSARGETVIAGPAVVEANAQVKTVSEAIEEEEEREKAEWDVEREALMNSIPGLLKDNPNGLKMVEIAETLGIENWRSLIPVMKKLQDNGEVRKDDSTYYTTV